MFFLWKCSSDVYQQVTDASEVHVEFCGAHVLRFSCAVTRDSVEIRCEFFELRRHAEVDETFLVKIRRGCCFLFVNVGF